MSLHDALLRSDTSHVARESIELKLPRLRALVLDAFLLHRSGLTDFELCEVTGLRENTARPRRRELVQSGKVIDGGERRKSPSGHSAIVWRVPLWL